MSDVHPIVEKAKTKVVIRYAIPGEIIAKQTENNQSGAFTHTRNKNIVASVTGRVCIEGKEKQIISIANPSHTNMVPTVGSVVICKIRRVTPRLASSDIVVVNGTPLDEAFPGIIRRQNVREHEIDSVVVAKCFLPGDYVRAEVLSLGDARSYYLSTAKDEYGVFHALSAVAHQPMIPIDLKSMECPQTRMVEQRKVSSTVLQNKM